MAPKTTQPGEKPEMDETQVPTEKKSGSGGSLTAKDVIDRYNAGAKPLRSQHFNYWLNDSYVLGDQWLNHNSALDRIESIPMDDRVQVTVNEMWPASRTIIANAVKQPLQFYVPASAADDATVRGARTSESILVDLHREHNWEGIREDCHWAAWKGGTAAIRIVWDQEAGTPLGMEEDGKTYSTGDTYEDVLNITDFVVEPGSRDAEHARWWAVCIGLPPKRVQEMFGLAKEPPADAAAAATPFYRSVTGLGSTQPNTSGEIPLTRVYTLYQRPTKDDARGAVVSVVDGMIVDDKPWPFPFKDRLNMVIVRETRRDGTWVGETVLKSARPVQNAINQAWSSIIEHMKLAGNARLMVPESMIDTLDALTDLAGEAIPFPDGKDKMGYLTPPVMPNWWIEAPDKLKDKMDDILGVHEVQRGGVPGRVDSGLAISILTENDSTPVGRFIKETAGAFGRLATMALQLYEANVKETRTAVVKTPGQPARKHAWTGKALKHQVQAEVPLDAITPRNEAADQAVANGMMQQGLIKSVEEWHKVAHIPFDRDLLEALSPDVAKARRENASMALGEIEVPEPFDDHTSHIHEHLTQMKSEDWDSYDDETKDTFRKHNQAHENMAAEQIARQSVKAQLHPALATTGDANGAPILPMSALAAAGSAGAPAAPAGPAMDPALALAAAMPLPGDPNAAGKVALQSPGIDPSLIQQEVGPIAGI